MFIAQTLTIPDLSTQPVSAYVALGLAAMTMIQIIIMAGITAWSTSRKEKRDSERSAIAAKLAAELKSAEKAEDWRRQDEVAARAAETAKLLVSSTREAARIAAESDLKTQTQLQAIDEQGRKIHSLVNSDMTAARQNELNQTRLTLVALKRVQALTMSLKLPIDPATDAEIENAGKRIEELTKIIADRQAAQDAELKATSIQTTAVAGTLKSIEANTAATADNTAQTAHIIGHNG